MERRIKETSVKKERRKVDRRLAGELMIKIGKYLQQLKPHRPFINRRA